MSLREFLHMYENWSKTVYIVDGSDSHFISIGTSFHVLDGNTYLRDVVSFSIVTGELHIRVK